MQTVIVNNFSRGVHTDENLAFEGYVREVQGMDIHGTGAGTFGSNPHRPGVYMPSQRMTAETEGATSASTNITTLMEWITPYSSRTYGVDSGTRLYVSESTPATDSTQLWYYVSAVSTATGGGGLLPFGTSLYIGQNTVLGKTDGTTANTQLNFQTFTDTTVTPRPMIIFGGKLCIGNGRYVATLDSDETTFNGSALTLPINFAIRSLSIWNERLSIAADYTPSGATNPTASGLFFWDGTASTFTQQFVLPFTAAPLIGEHDNLLWIFGSDGALNGLVFTFNGAQLEKAFFLPSVIWHGNGGLTKFQSNMLIATNGRTNSDEGGIWTVGRGGVEKPYGCSLSHIASPNSVTGTNVGAVYAESNNILCAWYDGTNYGADRSSNALFPASGGLIQTLPMHFGSSTQIKNILSIRPDLEVAGTTTGSTLQILYRTDFASSFTALKTINDTDSPLSPLISLRNVRGRRIEFQFKWVTTSNAPIRMRSFSVNYSLLGKAR